jgi:hypothetical protein
MAALFGAIAFGLRPDGMLIPAAVVLVRMWREPRYALTVVCLWTAFIFPWLAWATFYYGSPIPHSIVAKRMIHPSSFIESASALFERLTRSDLEIVLNLAGIVGLARCSLDPSRRVFALWLLMYMIGLAASGVDPLFYWYAAPWWTWIIVVGLPGTIEFAGTWLKGPNQRSRIATAAISVLLCLTVIQACAVRKVASERFESIRLYRDAIPRIASRFRDGDSMYLCETGYIGFEFPSAYIYDSAGINSPQVLDLVRQPVNGIQPKTIDRHILSMKRFEPMWIISLRDICSIREVEAAEWFRQKYELFLEIPSDVSGGLVVFRRRE